MKTVASLSIFLFAIASTPSAEAALTFEGAALPVVQTQPEASTGLETVAVVANTTGVRAVWQAASASAKVEWSRFSNLGGGFAEPVNAQRDGTRSWVELTADDMGYIVSENGRNYCFWVVNYANHPLRLTSLGLAEQDCSSTILLLDGSADKITYYTINGAAKTLSRDLALDYTTLIYDEDLAVYTSTARTETLPSAAEHLSVPSSYCQTDYTLTGDRFLKEWGTQQQVVSPSVEPVAVACHATAVQTERTVDNEQNVSAQTDLGGSAPVEITFSAAATDAAIFREWQFADDPEFDLLKLSIKEDEVTRTFTDAGTTYVRFLVANADDTCEDSSETYQVFIGESRLEIPNAFSPGTSEGTNDEWKVSYKSIVEFDCHIYNRWGQELAHLTDPSQGWDGRHGGKVVPAGVYFYAITAVGADGQRYNKAGDINVIGFKPATIQGGSSE